MPHRGTLASLATAVVVAALLLVSCAPVPAPPYDVFDMPDGEITLAFAVASDMRDYAGDDPRYFRGAAERLRDGGPGAFMVSAGDIDPPAVVHETLTTYVAADYGWFPVVGNHEAETPADMDFIRAFDPGGAYVGENLRPGPVGAESTTYSFDAGGIHFVILNEYFDGTSDTGTDGDIPDATYNWLVSDLESRTEEIALVFGHEPAYVLPDADTGRLRHEDDSLNLYPANRDRFWDALEAAGATAYICGHTHNYSVQKFGSVWQVDSGHARGIGDTGAPSTFLMLYATTTGELWLYPYRTDAETNAYELALPVQLH